MEYDDDNAEVQLAATPRRGGKQEHEGQLTVDVFQDDGDIVIQSTIAGVTSSDMDISITKDTVTIKGRRSPDRRVRPSDYFYQELYWGPFSRSIILPADIDPDSAKASMKNGVLTIRLPRLDKVRTKKIRVE